MWLKELQDEARAIDREEFLLKAGAEHGPEYERKMRLLMARAGACFKEVHDIRRQLHAFCRHDDKVMVGPGGSWYCRFCGKVHYEPPERARL